MGTIYSPLVPLMFLGYVRLSFLGVQGNKAHMIVWSAVPGALYKVFFPIDANAAALMARIILDERAMGSDGKILVLLFGGVQIKQEQ